MSDILQKPGFLIWTKGPAALEAMRDALSGHIQAVWIDHLETFTLEEINHLEQFIQDMNAGFAKVHEDKKTKKKEWVLTCKHNLCESLFKRLIEIRTNKKSKKIVWKTNCTTIQMLPRNPFLTGLAEIFDNHRAICETYYWHIANMFMLYGTEENETSTASPSDTDVSLILKMLKNCTLFKIDEEELYGNVSKARNRIFHTAQYNMTENGMHLMIKDMTHLLKEVQELSNCTSEHKNQIAHGIAQLEEIDKREVVSISLKSGTGWLSMAVQALQLQKRAVLFDIAFNDTTFDTTALRDILKDAIDRIKMYTDNENWRKNREREEEERRRKEWGKIIGPLKEKIWTLEEELYNAKQNIGNCYGFWCRGGHHDFFHQNHTRNDRLRCKNNERHQQEERDRRVREDMERREQAERDRRLREDTERRQQGNEPCRTS